MLKPVISRLGVRAVHAVAGGHLQGSRLNLKLGLTLLRDRRVGIWIKLAALALGAAAAGALIALEFPLETILAVLLPGLGLGLDLIADGMEAIAVPLLLAGLALPFMAPRALVDQVMAERAAGAALPLPPAATP